VRGELSAGLGPTVFIYRGGRVAARPDPIKPFKINRVPANANNCSGLALRTKKPSAKAGRFRLARVAPSFLHDLAKSICLRATWHWCQ